ncbi:large conductance mechanosensitive channel protein MscL [Sulfurihydrogenibium sp.]|jgi:large conductance mechanosensitive channel|uniref:large conductance mechanosensitive channel protein MscL n=1 Tax=Sulfurihydrogenibium sp. TaxID=2053621 RepID=UPI002621CCCA|nr:large conductance mechanosensitive channel protein MscL [Sulfurihydrogenibium sp.]
MLKGYKEFIMRGNVIDLAVAVIIGAAFNQIVNSLVSDVLTPAIGALFSVPDFSGLKVGPIALGKFINAVINFLFVSAAIYFLIVAPMNELAKRKKEEAPATPPEPPEEVKLLREILEELRKKA